MSLLKLRDLFVLVRMQSTHFKKELGLVLKQRRKEQMKYEGRRLSSGLQPRAVSYKFNDVSEILI